MVTKKENDAVLAERDCFRRERDEAQSLFDELKASAPDVAHLAQLQADLTACQLECSAVSAEHSLCKP